MSASALDASNIPSDIWWRIMAECGPYEVKSLASCCSLFHKLANSRTVWLKCLQHLSPSEPPSIPKHIRTTSLCTQELRRIAVDAHRRYLVHHSDAVPKVTQESVISLKEANPDEVLGEPGEFGLQLFLLPGGEHLLIYWPAGYLQCWSVRDKACLWVYPDLPEGASEDRPKLLFTFDFDMQENGDVHLLLLDEFLQGDQTGDMSWNIMKFSATSCIEKVYSGQRLHRTYGAPVIARLRGSLAILYQQLWGLPLGTLTVFFTDEGKSVTVNYINIECLEVANDFIICLSNVGNGCKSLNILLLTELYKAARAADEPQYILSGSDALSSAMLLESKSFSLRKPQLSVNTLHWKARTDQDEIYIIVLYKDRISKGTPFARFVLNNPKKQHPTSIWPLLSMYSLGDDKLDVPLDYCGRTFASYTTLTPPTLSGRFLALLHNNNLVTEGDDKLALAILDENGGIKFKPLSLGTDYHETEALSIEFYSSAVYFATKDYDSVIIRNFE